MQQCSNNGLPLKIKSLSTQASVEAELDKEGNLWIDDLSYALLDAAMGDVLSSHLTNVRSTSDGWEFWAWFCKQRQTWLPLEHLRAKLANQTTHAQIRTS